MFFLLPENCQYPFGPLFRLLNVFAVTYFLVYDLLTPFSCAFLMLIYSCKNRSPVRVLVHFATLIITTDFDFSHLAQLLADLNSDGVQKLLAFIGTILLVRYFLDSTTIHDLWFISPYIFHRNALCWQKIGPKYWSLKIQVSSEDKFGWYGDGLSTKFQWMATDESTTQYWFGAKR